MQPRRVRLRPWTDADLPLLREVNAKLVARHAREHGSGSALHAFPSTDNPASNAVCRKCGFELVAACDFEYPPGRLMRVNDWRLGLTSERG